MNKRILITGASGCIGHYVTEQLIQQTYHQLFLLVRDPSKLGFDTTVRSGIQILQADLRQIDQFHQLLSTLDIAILIATSWGGREEIFDINVNSVISLLQGLNSQCQQVIYFSTASILDHNHQLLPEAGTIGTDYISSKYQCLTKIQELTPNLPPIRVLFPTLVLGGAPDKPSSHVSSGISEIVNWLPLIRWFKTDASFHFVHGADIAQVVSYLIEHPAQNQDLEYFVLGSAPTTVNQVIEDACRFFQQRIYFRFNLALWLANIFIKVFRIQMADWDRFCLNYRHFTYQNPVSPATFQLPVHCATVTDIFQLAPKSNDKRYRLQSSDFNLSKP
ncbi:MAG: NAD(P)-dependent oxidoreductase [Oscillatoriales cyanobacterium RM2_1_1]|nr:NAD(P)-dependent oxidoreductase [Oscillatoriales cyanobacterium SM2_3_0]NJO46593.1 NAD(P)-dependent oxidoreductase [Oscillatoriales cyanobacterium RM2_1_1]